MGSRLLWAERRCHSRQSPRGEEVEPRLLAWPPVDTTPWPAETRLQISSLHRAVRREPGCCTPRGLEERQVPSQSLLPHRCPLRPWGSPGLPLHRGRGVGFSFREPDAPLPPASSLHA